MEDGNTDAAMAISLVLVALGKALREIDRDAETVRRSPEWILDRTEAHLLGGFLGDGAAWLTEKERVLAGALLAFLRRVYRDEPVNR